MKTPKKELKALLNLAKECLEKPNSEVCQTYKDKILDACPSLKVESDVLEVAQWYDFCIGTFFITKFTNKVEVKGYGFLNNEWEDNRSKNYFMGTKNDDDWKKADPKKVKELLTKEIQKNIKIGDEVEYLDGTKGVLRGYTFSFINNVLYASSGKIDVLFKDGKFAKPIETISLSEAEKILNKKIKID